jgi:hypothetical protein
MTEMPNSPQATDLLSVRSRISWGAIAAGAMVALSIYVVLTLLGIALGIEVAMRGASAHLGAAAAIFSILTLLLAMFFGGWTTSRLAVGESKLEAVLYGIILWATLFIGMVWLLNAGIQIGFGAMIGMASATDAAYRVGGPDSSASSGVAEALRQRYASELGGDRFVADLKKAGFSEEQARKAEIEIKGRIDRIRDDPSSLPEVTRDVANQPEVQRAAATAAEKTREASWWTLIGVIISMTTAIVGSLIGSGELLQPVPILGVRRASAPRR